MYCKKQVKKQRERERERERKDGCLEGGGLKVGEFVGMSWVWRRLLSFLNTWSTSGHTDTMFCKELAAKLPTTTTTLAQLGDLICVEHKLR